MGAMAKMQWPRVLYSTTILGGGVTGLGASYPGGLDLVTPSLSLRAGALRDVLNFECSQSGGYSRIEGYERADGQTAPSLATYQIVQVASFANVPTVGQSISQSSSGATGVVASVNNAPGAYYMAVTRVSGVFDTTGIISSVNDLVVTSANSPFIITASVKSVSWAFDPDSVDSRWDIVWTNAIFAVPLWEGSGQSVTDLVSGASFLNTGTAATWPADTYGTALQGSGVYGAGTSFTDASTGSNNPGHLTGSYTYIYYGRFAAPGASNFQVAQNAYNDVSNAAGPNGQSYGLVVAGSGIAGLTANGLVPGDGSALGAIDTGFVAGDGVLRLYAIEYNVGTSVASLYINGSLYATYPFTPCIGDGPNPKMDFCAGNLESGYGIVANAVLGADFHAALGLDPFGPFRQSGSIHGPLSVPYQTMLGTSIQQTVSITSLLNAQYLAAVADIYRALIRAVPGSGAILGVVGMVFSGADNLYAFRANVAGTAVAVYKSSATGWALVPFFNTVSFTAGGTSVPIDGETLTQGGVTATIKRTMWQSGAWSGTAVGQFVVTTPSGGNFTAGVATTTSGATVTLSGAITPITLLPGGHFQFVKCNFSGQSVTRRIYGCDGVNKAFEFDGTTLAPISTGNSPDAPTNIAFHKNFLFVSQDSSLFYCGVGTPFKWGSVDGGGEIATGDQVTGMLTLPGAQTTAALGVYSRSDTNILYGTDPTTFNFVSFNTGIGCLPYSAQNIFDTFAFDHFGVVTLQTSLNYGNFAPNTLTKNILPFIIQERGKLSASTIARDKGQYRVFFNDGYGLWLTTINQRYLGATIIQFPNPVSCCDVADLSTGDEAIYFGSSDGNGYVYRMESGTSFDGEDIDAHITLAWDPLKTPRILKRFRAASIEMQGDGYAAVNFGYQLGYGSSNIGQPGTVATSSNFASIPVWDEFVWDNFIWDGQTLSPTDVDVTGTAENIQVILSSSTNYMSAFNINSVVHHYSMRRGMRV